MPSAFPGSMLQVPPAPPLVLVVSGPSGVGKDAVIRELGTICLGLQRGLNQQLVSCALCDSAQGGYKNNDQTCTLW